MRVPRVPLTSDKSSLAFAVDAGGALGDWRDRSVTGDGNHSACERDRAISVAGLKLGPFLLWFCGFFVMKMSLD